VYVALQLALRDFWHRRLSFFFQAEDGIRDGHVTGVQTCALPTILSRPDAKPARATNDQEEERCSLHIDELHPSGASRGSKSTKLRRAIRGDEVADPWLGEG